MAAATTAKAKNGGVKAPSVNELEALAPQKSPAGKAEKATDPPAEQGKSGGAFKAALLASLCWLVLISAVILLIIYDPTEYKDIRNMALLFLNPEEEALDDYYYDKVPELLDWERELYDREAELDVYEAELDVFSDELDERESVVSDREDEAEYLLEELGGTEGGGVIMPDLTAIGKTFAAMSPARAAELLAGMDEVIAAQICQTMNAKALGPIFDAMDIDAATLIMEASTEPIELE
ncbi:MAG: hypothetical protein LBR76_01555 [Oscillospiraceae bacterium]|jgi:flagellar motility protein MotE (MotC chaperone)|nr:hypothetical protein [Oscillospiraceae bacterium]